MRILIALILVPALLVPAAAQTPPTDNRVKLALQLIELTEARRQMEQQMATVLKAQVDSIMARGRSAGVPESDLAKLEPLQQEVRELVMKEIGWEHIAREAANAYAALFTEQELKDMVAFYQSPSGKAWVAKFPEFSSKMVQITQQRMQLIAPKVQELIQKRLGKSPDE
jgi:hypothetical protein